MKQIDVEEIKEELLDFVVEFENSILMGTELNKEAREELLSKINHIRETSRTLYLDPVRTALL